MHNDFNHKMKLQICSSVHRGKVLCLSIRFIRLISVLLFESENKLLPYRLVCNVKNYCVLMTKEMHNSYNQFYSAIFFCRIYSFIIRSTA